MTPPGLATGEGEGGHPAKVFSSGEKLCLDDPPGLATGEGEGGHPGKVFSLKIPQLGGCF